MIKRNWKSVVFLLGLVIGINLWQSRKMPRGEAPHSFVTAMDGETSVELPSGKESIELIYFFAPWCGVCELSAPNAATVAKWFPDLHLSYVGLDYEDLREVKYFADQHLQGEVYLGNAAVKDSWAVEAYPAYAIVDKSGKFLTLRLAIPRP